MQKQPSSFIHTKTSKIVFLFSLFISIYWVIAWGIDIYSNGFVGAVFEALWPAVMLATFILPAIALFFLIKAKFNFRSLYLYSIILIVLTVLVVRLIIS